MEASTLSSVRLKALEERMESKSSAEALINRVELVAAVEPVVSSGY
jgi:hypothetical protein